MKSNDSHGNIIGRYRIFNRRLLRGDSPSPYINKDGNGFVPRDGTIVPVNNFIIMQKDIKYKMNTFVNIKVKAKCFFLLPVLPDNLQFL